ncbi:MAG: hypothetical protein IT245_07615 [Bacteroidia bacterium]|nr:hypothetical protein [Bacteroidia bacterium]
MKKFNGIKNIFFLTWLLFGFACVNEPSINCIDGSDLSMDKNQATYIFLNAECPICRKYAGSWKQLAMDSIKPIFIFPGIQSTAMIQKLMNFDSVESYRIALDPDYILTRHLDATVTPQAIIVDKGKVCYSGKIDDRFESLGSSKTKASVNYIRNALNSLKKNESITVPVTLPVGCVIERN